MSDAAAAVPETAFDRAVAIVRAGQEVKRSTTC
jgi:hypothetical protein